MPTKKAVKSPNTKTAKAKKEEKTPKFEVILEMNGEVYKEKTDDVAKALMDLKPEYLVKTKCLLTVKSGKKEVTRLLMPSKIKRLFINRIAAQCYVDSLMPVFNG